MSKELKPNASASKAVTAELLSGEAEMVQVQGPNGQCIIGTDRRAFVYKKGFMAGATLGQKVTAFDYGNITAVELHTGMMSGTVAIRAAGEVSTSTSYWQSGKHDPHHARNAIPVVRPFDVVEERVRALRSLIAEFNARTAPTAGGNGPGGPDVIEQIEKLAALHQSGALTDAEFESKKADLLSRL